MKALKRTLQLTPKEWKAFSESNKKMMKLLGFKAPIRQKRRVDKTLRPTAPKDYILRKTFSCVCCKTISKETYHMKYIEEENKTSWDECLQAIPFNGKCPPDKEEKTTLHTCKSCKTALAKLSQDQLIRQVMHLNVMMNYGG